jgi:uncharacterized membrane protein
MKIVDLRFLAFSQSVANMILLVIVTNLIIAFIKLNYSIEYIGAGIFLAFLLLLRLVLTSRSNAIRAVKTAKRNVE